jgi:hypothetical protein
VISLKGAKNTVRIETNNCYDIYDSGIMNDIVILDKKQYKSLDDGLDMNQLIFNHLHGNTREISAGGIQEKMKNNLNRIRVSSDESNSEVDSSLSSTSDEYYKGEKIGAPILGTREKDLADEKQNKEIPDCPICMNKMTRKCKLEYLACAHCFHRGCIFEWYKTKKTCPVCKMKEPLFQEDAMLNGRPANNHLRIVTRNS